ncbi:MAG: transcription antitermination factor NusB [Zoogloeaceae bacterium]|nr:transcription antitermination factor NusB [Zoogloeaceae bacterium]
MSGGGSSARSPRRRAREFALQGVYQWLLADHPVAAIEAHLKEVSGFDKADQAMCFALLRGTLALAPTLEAEFGPFLDRPIAELSPVERAVLLLATYEFTQCPKVPYRVVINEAIELTKSFGGAEGHRFVNGVLDKLAPRLRAVEVSAATPGGSAAS